jgi:hypothetical protein
MAGMRLLRSPQPMLLRTQILLVCLILYFSCVGQTKQTLIVCLAFLGLTAILNARNARLSADTGKAISGLLEWITPPVRPVQKRALKFFS